MSRRRRPGLALVLVAVGAAALSGCGLRNPDAASSPRAPAAATPHRSAPRLTPAQVNRQDHPPAALVRSQAAAAAARPMLPALPITAAGVTIAVGGLAPDGRTTILTLTSALGRAHALAVYRHELRRYGDTGRAYQTSVQP